MAEPTLNELREAKQKLEGEFTTMLQKFQHDFGISIVDIEVSHINMSHVENPHLGCCVNWVGLKITL